jgi:FtsP/CotA-like multicopper oxidase with cupredoxin domain
MVACDRSTSTVDTQQSGVTIEQGSGTFDIPVGAPPSPLFGAQPFTQQMLLFEEFGRDSLADAPAASRPFPQPASGSPPENDASVAASGPLGSELDAFLGQAGISPAPTELANDTLTNPWQAPIQTFLGRDLVHPPAEGRPPGPRWAHQRWDEFHPQVYFQTAQAGARQNHGLRDAKQRHGYTAGEFGADGLYHTVFDSTISGTKLVGSTAGLLPRFHPLMPVQDHKSVWTFDGTLPPKLAVARYGEAILMRHYNALPIDPGANRGFGIHTITTHEHNGHNPAESDGYTNAFFFPGQFYDYRWPMELAGYDTVNTTASDPRAAFPCVDGEQLFVNDGTANPKTCSHGRIQLRGDWRETMSTHWFHDHMLDFTAQNVYKGNAVMFNYYSALDRGNEAVDDGVNLRLPSGTALPWGNRDYDVNLVFADKAWDSSGQLWFNVFNTNGFLGDQVLTNWLYKPYFEVRARRYRFRILNGAVSRFFAFALVKKVNGPGGEFPGPAGSGISYDRVTFHIVANDGNLMEHAVPFDGSVDLNGDGNLLDHKGILPTQGIAERFDIVVDFAANGIRPGDLIYFVNTIEHRTGRGVNAKIPLGQILSEAYKPVATATGWSGGDPGVGKVLELRVKPYTGVDQSMNPADYTVAGGKTMIPLAIDRNDPRLQSSIRRQFVFGRTNATDDQPWGIKTDTGDGFLNMDPLRISAAPQLATGPTQPGFNGVGAGGSDDVGTLEIWDIQETGAWSHPVHVHFEEGVILKRGGQPPPEWERWARKDVYRVGTESDGTSSIEMAIRFRDFAGTYMEHCHNTQHEDHAMLLRWDIEHPGQTLLMPAPIPTWDGVEYVDSAALPTYHTGVGIGPSP